MPCLDILVYLMLNVLRVNNFSSGQFFCCFAVSLPAINVTTSVTFVTSALDWCVKTPSCYILAVCMASFSCVLGRMPKSWRVAGCWLRFLLADYACAVRRRLVVTLYCRMCKHTFIDATPAINLVEFYADSATLKAGKSMEMKCRDSVWLIPLCYCERECLLVISLYNCTRIVRVTIINRHLSAVAWERYEGVATVKNPMVNYLWPCLYSKADWEYETLLLLLHKWVCTNYEVIKDRLTRSIGKLGCSAITRNLAKCSKFMLTLKTLYILLVCQLTIVITASRAISFLPRYAPARCTSA